MRKQHTLLTPKLRTGDRMLQVLQVSPRIADVTFRLGSTLMQTRDDSVVLFYSLFKVLTNREG